MERCAKKAVLGERFAEKAGLHEEYKCRVVACTPGATESPRRLSYWGIKLIQFCELFFWYHSAYPANGISYLNT